MTASDASAITPETLPPFALRMRRAAGRAWEEGYRQPFIRELGRGTLPRETFAFYLIQDELYLNDYAKVHALAITKTDDAEVMAHMTQVLCAIFRERSMHADYLASYGVTAQRLRDARQSAFARAYTANMLAVAYGRDLVDILVAVLPCAWVYADYGRRLAEEFAGSLASNPYRDWIDVYASESFWHSSAWLIARIETLVADLDERRRRELIALFVAGVENEYMFWASAYDRQMGWLPSRRDPRHGER